MKLDTMTGTGRAIVSTPAMAHRDPTIFPHTPTGLLRGNIFWRILERRKVQEPGSGVVGF